MQTIRFYLLTVVLIGIWFSGALSACGPAAQTPTAPTFAPTLATLTIAPTTVPATVATTAIKESADIELVGQIKDAPGGFTEPFFVETDTQGNLYVLDDEMRVLKFDADGKFLMQWGGVGSGEGKFLFNSGGSIDVDKAGNVFIADTNNNRIEKFSSTGEFLASFAGDGPKQEKLLPSSVAVDEQGNLYIADFASKRIQKWYANGKYITAWGGWGETDGKFKEPGEVRVDSNGNVYVADFENENIQKFDSNGNFLSGWNRCDASGQDAVSTIHPASLAIDRQDAIYIVDVGYNRICKFDADGNLLAAWNIGKFFPGNTEQSGAFTLTVDPQGFIYIPDAENQVINKFRVK